MCIRGYFEKIQLMDFLFEFNSAKTPIEMRYTLDRTIRSSKDIKSQSRLIV